jgi:hypothetical protein
MDSSDAVSVGVSEDFSLFSLHNARDDKRAARPAERAAEVVRKTASRAQAKTELPEPELKRRAIRKFSLAVLVLIAATVATGAAVDSAAAALRVGRNVDFTTCGAADGARACAAASAVASTSVTPTPVARVVAPDLTDMGARFAALAVSCATGVSGAPLLPHDFDGSAPIACTLIRPDNAVFHFLDTETDLRTAFARRVSRRRRKV